AGVASVGFSQRGGFDASFTNTTQLANGINAKSSIGFNSKSGFSASVGVSADFGNGVTSGGLSLNKNGVQFQAPSYQAPQAAGTGVIHSLQDLEGQVDTIAEANSEKLVQEKRIAEAEKFRKEKKLPDSMTLEEIEALRKNLAEAGVATGTGADGTSRKGFLAELSGGVSDMWNGIAGNYQAASHKGYVDDQGVFHQRTCFVAGTKIHTKDGLKNIEDIRVGDVVLSWNEKTGEREYKVVTELFLHEVELLFEVKTTKGTTLETTWNHPFWVVNKKAWVEVKDLRVGDVLALADGALVEISHIRSYDVEPTKVYNFEVEDNHSYFVGEDGVLVHNYEPIPANIGPGISFSSIKEGISNAIDATMNGIGKAVDLAKEYGAKAADFLADSYNYVGDGLMKASSSALNSITGTLDGYKKLWNMSDDWGFSSVGEIGKTLGRLATIPLAIPAYGLHVATNMTAMVAGTILQPASIVDYTWGSIGTGLGLVAGTAQILAGNRATVENGAVLFKDSNLMNLTVPKGYMNAMSLGPVLSGSKGFNDWRHEFGHSQDNRLIGPGYLGVMIASPFSVKKEQSDRANRVSTPHKHKDNWTEKRADNKSYQDEWDRRSKPWDWGKR
ncbi:polymorphic toxin-type HINT domain-containing protein, partial [Leptospira meyeri]|uniref:polymorphic toxin-type HINT domain-containing protein n=1 Tax=Leptospira meyeri TaxID=29508 RepID=UPI0011047652